MACYNAFKDNEGRNEMDIYSIGEMVIDFLPGEKEGEYIRNAGGAPANVTIAAARNGLETGMCCKVGDDDFGRFLVDTLKKEHVKVICNNLCEEAITTMAFVSLAGNGERTFTFARKTSNICFYRWFCKLIIARPKSCFYVSTK